MRFVKNLRDNFLRRAMRRCDFKMRLDFVQCAFVARKVKFDVARVHRLSV